MAEPRSLGVEDAVVTAIKQTPSGRRQIIHYGRRWWRGDGVRGVDAVGKLIISPIPLDETADARQRRHCRNSRRRERLKRKFDGLDDFAFKEKERQRMAARRATQLQQKERETVANSMMHDACALHDA